MRKQAVDILETCQYRHLSWWFHSCTSFINKHSSTYKMDVYVCSVVFWLNAPDRCSGLVSEKALSTTRLRPRYFIRRGRTGQAKAW